MLLLLESGLNEREIGCALFVSRDTLHSHVHAIYRKLAVSTRADALERTRELGLLNGAAKTTAGSHHLSHSVPGELGMSPGQPPRDRGQSAVTMAGPPGGPASGEG